MDIKVDNLTLNYEDKVVQKNLSFSIESGQKVCIGGRSGCGKTTLLKALAGLVEPKKGTIRVGKEIIDSQSVWEVRKKIAYICQEPDLGHENVWDRITQPFSFAANSHLTCDRAVVLDYFKKLHLDEKLLEEDASNLSGGQKQRIAIIIALLLKRPVLLLDEPVSAMDKENKQGLKELLIEADDKTIIFISHDHSLLDIADKTIELEVL